MAAATPASRLVAAAPRFSSAGSHPPVLAPKTRTVVPTARKPPKKTKHEPHPYHRMLPSLRTLLPPELESKSDFQLVEGGEAKERDLRSLVALMPVTRTLAGMQIRLRLINQGTLAANSANGKYNQFLAGSAFYLWANLATASEFTALDAMFDEVFIHSVSIRYIPNNKRNGLYGGAGVATNLSSCAACVWHLPHNAAGYTDTAMGFSNAQAAQQHRVVELGETWAFTSRNIERFDPAGPLTDQSTAASAQGWCQFSNVASKMGGFIGITTYYPTAAAASASAFAANQTFGVVGVTFDISVRARA